MDHEAAPRTTFLQQLMTWLQHGILLEAVVGKYATEPGEYACLQHTIRMRRTVR